jgi:HEPN domain-containing protein
MSDPDRLPIELPREWLRYAEGDLRVAERESAADEPSYHTICFLCQSAAEKFLKGYLLAQGWELEKTHDLLILLNRCSRHSSTWDDLLPEGEVLNEYVIAGRYPGDLSVDDIGKTEVEEALQAVRRIRARVTALMAEG